MRRKTGVAAAVIAALAAGVALAAGLAGAAQTTIGFDDLPDGTVVGSQYADRGVVFGTAGRQDRVQVQADDGARSSSNVASFSNCPADSEVIGCSNRATGHLSRPATAVTLYAGSTDPEDVGDFDEVVLEGFDASGASLGTDMARVRSAAAFTTRLTITAPTGKMIAKFEIRLATAQTTNARLGVDDLTITAPDSTTPPTTTPPPIVAPPPPTGPLGGSPDFAMGLRFAGAPLGTATVNAGGTATVDLVISRIGNSSGPINVSVQGGPRTAAVTVDSTGDPNHKRVHIEAKTGKDALGEASVRLVGVPSSAAAGSVPRTLTFTLRVIRRYDLRVIGMEVTQGTQRTFGSEGSFQGPGLNESKRSAIYGGVPLTVGPRTVVRVFANVPSGTPVKGVGAALSGTLGNGNKPLPGGPLWPSFSETTLSPGPAIGGLTEHTSHANSFTFTLPASWTANAGKLNLSAKLIPPPDGTVASGTGTECGDVLSCKHAGNNGFSVVGIPVSKVPKITILPLALTADGKSLPSPAKVFSTTRAVTPLGGAYFEVRPYAAEIDVTGLVDGSADWRSDVLLSKVREWGNKNFSRLGPRTILVGVQPGNSTLGVSIGNVGQMAGFLADVKVSPKSPNGWSYFPPAAVVDANIGRPLTDVSHEIGHQLERPHASAACEGEGEPWPEDEKGFLQGIGLDRRVAPYGSYTLLHDKGTLPQKVMFDYMSYCASLADVDSWISPRNWTNMFHFLRGLGSAPQPSPSSSVASAVTAQTGSAIEVFGGLTGSGPPQIHIVGPSKGPPSTNPTVPGIRLVARNAAGEVVGTAAPTLSAGHTDARPSRRVVQFAGRVPAAGARSVELVGSRGQMLARRVASPTAPKVTLLSPRARRRISARGTTRVRARIADRDPGKHDVELRFSENGGRSFRTLRARGGVSSGTVTFRVHNRALAATRRGVFEVVANDGFEEASDRSQRLQIAGVPPVVRIEEGRRIRTNSAQVVSFEGTATDDRGLPLPARKLSWFDGRRRVGSGPSVTLVRMRPGRHIVRLVGSDRLQRKGTARVIVRVAAASPRFLLARGPRSLSRRARTAKLRIATTVPARLTVGGRSFRVGPRARRITVRLPRRRPSSLRLAARAAGRSSQLRMELPR